ncbi:hypothetical protein FAIPA1_100045 [Frankia sp. AiPs1]
MPCRPRIVVPVVPVPERPDESHSGAGTGSRVPLTAGRNAFGGRVVISATHLPSTIPAVPAQRAGSAQPGASAQPVVPAQRTVPIQPTVPIQRTVPAQRTVPIQADLPVQLRLPVQPGLSIPAAVPAVPASAAASSAADRRLAARRTARRSVHYTGRCFRRPGGGLSGANVHAE